MASFLFVRPVFEDEAMIYNVLTLPIKAAAVSLGHEVHSLEDDATPENVWAAVEAYNPDLIFSVGHGCATIHTVKDNRDVMWDEGVCGERAHYSDNLDAYAGRMVVLLSCDCGLHLIPAIHNNGASLAVGVHDIWYWVVNPEVAPEVDTYAMAFFDSFNVLVTSLLEGKTPKEAYDASILRHTEWVGYFDSWVAEHPDAAPAEVARALASAEMLESNKTALVMYTGNEVYGKSLSIAQYIPVAAVALGAILLLRK